jgi:hypothetical protein
LIDLLFVSLLLAQGGDKKKFMFVFDGGLLVFYPGIETKKRKGKQLNESPFNFVTN